MIATSVRPVLAHTTSMKSWEPQLAATTWFRHVSTESRGPMGPLESTGLSLAFHHFTCEHGHFGGETRSFEMWEDHMEGIEKMQRISPLCHCNIVKIYRIIFCVDDKVLIT